MNSFEVTYQHQSTAFQADQLPRYQLRLFLRTDLILYGVVDAEQKLLALKEYRKRAVGDFDSFFDAVFQQDYFLKEAYGKVQVINGHPAFSLIPTSHFKAERVKDFAGALIGSDDPHDSYGYCDMKESGATAVFAIPTAIKEKCETLLSHPEFLPVCDPLIKMSLDLADSEQEALIVTLLPEKFVIAGIRDGQLGLCNAYAYESAADLIYFIQLVTDILGMNPGKCKIFLNGQFQEEDPLFQQLLNFLPQAEVPTQRLKARFFNQSGLLPHSNYAFLSY